MCIRFGAAAALCKCLYVTLTGCRSRTGLARLVPGFSHIVGTAAHLLGHVEGQLVLTGVIKVTVTHAFPHVCSARVTESQSKG